MYLSGSKWNVRRKRPGLKIGRILLLVALIVGAVYIERFLVPMVPPLFVPTPTPTRSPATFALEAESFFQAGKLGQAEDSYRRGGETQARNALLITPDSPAAHAVLGWALDFQGDDRLVEAEAELKVALAAGPNSALAQAYLAEVLMDEYIGLNAGDYRDAVAAAELAVQLDPNIVETHRALGYVLERTSNYAQALQEYQRALTINPNLGILHRAVGNMYMSLDPPDLDEAIQSYLNASAFDPTNPVPLQLIATAYGR